MNTIKRARLLAIALPLLVLAAACGSPPPASPKPTFVLVHGAFQDERAWSEVQPRLEAAGHKVVPVRLAGRAGDATPVAQITLDGYREQVAAVLAAEPAPVVLVGHSFGGITIAAVAEALPQRVRTLVFVGAYLPQAGAADQSMAKLAEQDRWNGFTRENFVIAKDYQTAGVLASDVVALFCGDCSAADQARTQRDFHQREPLKPAGTPVVVSAARYGAVPKVYVKTLRDRAISPQMQQLMIERTPVKRVIEIDSGHSPFLSQPAALAQALLDAARE
jgi:pimeloyl-ACP methyl ester carboxylesterase